MNKMKTCLVVDIVGFTELCKSNSEKAEYVQEKLFSLTDGIAPTCCKKGKLVSTPGDAQLYLFDLPLYAVHCAIDLLAEIRKHNAKDVYKEFLVHIAITFGEIHETTSNIFTGTAINNAFFLAKVTLPNYILTDKMVYENLKSHPIDFRLISLDTPIPEYADDIFSVRTNENLNGGSARRIEELKIGVKSLMDIAGLGEE
jgi:class 3 adenylate cyclase